MLLQAAVERTAGGLSLGESIVIVTTGLSIGAILIKFGEMKADARNLRKNMEDELADVRRSVASALQDLNNRLDEILDFIHDSQQRRIDDAGWQERTTAAVQAAAKDASEAKQLVITALQGAK